MLWTLDCPRSYVSLSLVYLKLPPRERTPISPPKHRLVFLLNFPPPVIQTSCLVFLEGLPHLKDSDNQRDYSSRFSFWGKTRFWNCLIWRRNWDQTPIPTPTPQIRAQSAERRHRHRWQTRAKIGDTNTADQSAESRQPKNLVAHLHETHSWLRGRWEIASKLYVFILPVVAYRIIGWSAEIDEDFPDLSHHPSSLPCLL